jgi:hypothetical protein
MEGNTRLLALVGLVGALALLSAPASGSSIGDVVVTRNAVRLPEGCSSQQVAGLFAEFFTELETGDAGRLARFFAREDPPGKAIEPAGRAFRWYSVTEGGGAGPEVGGTRQPLRHFVAYDVADLLPYFAGRRRQNEHMQLVAVEVGASNISGAAGGTFVLRREADDLAPGLGGNQRIAYGKFELDCAERRFFVWSMGMDLAPGQDLARRWAPCPLPPGWTPGKPTVACTRGPNAKALAPGFRLTPTPVALPTRCRPAAMKRRVRTALSAYNLGLGDVFADSFVRDGEFQPYTMRWPGLAGRAQIMRFVRNRYRAGDGWTALRLSSPRQLLPLPGVALYFLHFRITYQGAPSGKQAAARLRVDCRNGKLIRWYGPARPVPPNRQHLLRVDVETGDETGGGAVKGLTP